MVRILCSAFVVTGFDGKDGVGLVVSPRASSSVAREERVQLPVA
ncbi:hypothetical protein CFAL_03675 [Corynebacterium falsenii DSM 44353]|nr:hypothetical protein CFAL_03675 [Corynebacterium falsenii DSM 44353]